MVLDGNGNQVFLRKSYESYRQKALEDRTRYDDDELEYYGITNDQGRGMTNYRKYQMLQWIPMNQTVRKRTKIDLRNRPQIGGKF